MTTQIITASPSEISYDTATAIANSLMELHMNTPKSLELATQGETLKVDFTCHHNRVECNIYGDSEHDYRPLNVFCYEYLSEILNLVIDELTDFDRDLFLPSLELIYQAMSDIEMASESEYC